MKKLDLLGHKFGELTVLYFARTKGGRCGWRCLCSCGKETTVQTSDLVSGNTWSCSHGRIEKQKLPPGVAAFNDMFDNYKNNAKNKGLSFTLSEEVFRKITKENCSYCGVSPCSVIKGKYSSYTYNGIDRVDNSKGYIKENVKPCCKICNYSKRNMTKKEFQEWIDRLVNFQNRERDAKSVGGK